MDNPLIENYPSKFVLDLDVARIIRQYDEIGLDVSRFLEGKHIQIRQCEMTGLRFYSGDRILGDGCFYEQLAKNNRGYYPRDKWEFRKAYSIVKRNAKLLEVGSGDGYFLEKAAKKGLDVEGLEYNREAVRTCVAKGLRVSDTTLEAFAKTHENRFDVVCAFQVLEHVELPGRFLKTALACLKIGGKLILAVPNNNPFLFKHDLYHTLNLPPHHAALWNRSVFERLPEFFPIRINGIWTSPVEDHKHWFRVQVEQLGRTKPTLAKYFRKIPRPAYKLVTKVASPFIEGQYLLVVFDKVARENVSN